MFHTLQGNFIYLNKIIANVFVINTKPQATNSTIAKAKMNNLQHFCNKARIYTAKFRQNPLFLYGKTIEIPSKNHLDTRPRKVI